jgi:hypothetical protein
MPDTVLPAPLSCSNYCDAYSATTKVTTAQWAAFRAFLQAADMLGTSNYPNGECMLTISLQLSSKQAYHMIDMHGTPHCGGGGLR